MRDTVLSPAPAFERGKGHDVRDRLMQRGVRRRRWTSLARTTSLGQCQPRSDMSSSFEDKPLEIGRVLEWLGPSSQHLEDFNI